jgi:hypothetical protein
MSSPAGGPEPDPAKPDPGVSRKPLEDFLGRTVAIATIVGFIAQGFGAALHTTAIVFVVTFLAAYPIHRYLKRPSHLQGRLRAAPVSRPVLVAVGLACILGGMLFRQHVVIGPAGVDVGELTDSFRWKMLWCRHFAQGQPKNDACKASAMASLADDVAAKNDYPGESLFADQVLGEILRSSPEAMSLLRKYYGVKEDGFLGTGLSEPSKQKDFAAERIPEYLVPNYPDTHEGVLVWKLDPILKYADKNLYETLKTLPPINSAAADKEQLKEMRATLNQRLAWGSSNPAVVRFAQIPRGKYSGCLGRIEAHEVFANHLGLIKASGLTVEEATRMSGFPFNPGANDELYVFIFIPYREDELNEATWSYLVKHVRSEMDKPSPCVQSLGSRSAH